eukprot:TRINITY_DN2291_c0_g1_i1.p1 TRINITY_DN2291_c0_g1~~TRINITY_DN2291_c0_g1_i1.p1  ORF type:complete len:541 (+),score=106.51 TRINITY_DN2291_c0_g1_i1:160-1782(+)
MSAVKRRSQVGIEEIAYFLHYPIQEAAQKLGICVALLKRICRQFGMKRWLHRKIMSVNRHVESYRGSAPSMTAKLAKRLTSLRQFRDTVLGHMQTTPIDNLIFHLQPLQTSQFSTPNAVMLQHSTPPTGISHHSPTASSPLTINTLESAGTHLPQTPQGGTTSPSGLSFLDLSRASLSLSGLTTPKLMSAGDATPPGYSPTSNLPAWMFNPRTRATHRASSGHTPPSTPQQLQSLFEGLPQTPTNRWPAWMNTLNSPVLSPRTQQMLFASGTGTTRPTTPTMSSSMGGTGGGGTGAMSATGLGTFASLSPLHLLASVSPPSTPRHGSSMMGSTTTPPSSAATAAMWPSTVHSTGGGGGAHTSSVPLSDSALLSRRAAAAAAGASMNSVFGTPSLFSGIPDAEMVPPEQVGPPQLSDNDQNSGSGGQQQQGTGGGEGDGVAVAGGGGGADGLHYEQNEPPSEIGLAPLRHESPLNHRGRQQTTTTATATTLMAQDDPLMSDVNDQRLFDMDTLAPAPPVTPGGSDFTTLMHKFLYDTPASS